MTPNKTPARLDADRTAEPLTSIVHHPPHGGCIGPYMPLVNPEHVDADGKRTPLTTPADPASPILLPIGAKYGMERAITWLEAHAVDIEAKVDDECDGCDADAFCAQAATIREAAREMAKAFGVAVPR